MVALVCKRKTEHWHAGCAASPLFHALPERLAKLALPANRNSAVEMPQHLVIVCAVGTHAAENPVDHGTDWDLSLATLSRNRATSRDSATAIGGPPRPAAAP